MRTPGPSTAEPVVNEWTNPQSPLSSAARMSVSPTRSPSDDAQVVGTADQRDVWVGALKHAWLRRPVEGAVDDVHLLLAGQPHEVHRVTGNADGERGYFSG